MASAGLRQDFQHVRRELLPIRRLRQADVIGAAHFEQIHIAVSLPDDFEGGGGIGPALMDNKWRYGSSLDQIYHSIADGRPNGMPTWRGKIPDSQIWQLAAYVKWLSTPEAWQARALPKTPLDPAGDVGYRQEPKFVSP